MMCQECNGRGLKDHLTLCAVCHGSPELEVEKEPAVKVATPTVVKKKDSTPRKSKKSIK